MKIICAFNITNSQCTKDMIKNRKKFWKYHLCYENIFVIENIEKLIFEIKITKILC